MPSSRSTSAKIAATERHHPGADTSELRRDHRAERLFEYAQKIVALAPPLTSDQRSRIAALVLNGQPTAAAKRGGRRAATR